MDSRPPSFFSNLSPHDVTQILTTCRLTRSHVPRLCSHLPRSYFSTANLDQLISAFFSLQFQPDSRASTFENIRSSSKRLLHLLTTSPRPKNFDHHLPTLLWSIERCSVGLPVKTRRSVLNPFADLVPKIEKYPTVRSFRQVCLSISKVSPFRVDVMATWKDPWRR